MAKDREKTEQKLLDAVGSVVREEGFRALGVNNVAQRAGVAKMLIYRYFGDFDGLLREWILKHNYWAETADEALERLKQTEKAGYRGLVKELFSGQAESLRTSGLRREVLRWLLVEPSEVGTQTLQTVEKLGAAITSEFGKKFSLPGDAEAVVALLIGGIYYLALVSDRVSVFNGVELDSDQGWRRITDAVDLLIDMFLQEETE